MHRSLIRSASHLKKTAGVVVALLALQSLVGCELVKKYAKKELDGDATSASTSKSGSTPGGPSGGQSDDPDAALGDKLNHPIECINRASPAVTRSRDRYDSWLKDPKAGPTGSESIVYGLYDVTDTFVDGCDKELKALAAQKTPATPDLDKDAATYQAKLDAVVPLIKEAVKYYDQSNYKDDGFKKGKELHPKLRQAFDEFAVADKAMHDDVTKLKAGMDEHELAAIEKREGKKIRWHLKKMMMVAKKLVETGEDDSPDVTKMDAAIKDLDAELGDTDAYIAAHKDEAGQVTMLSSVTGAAKDFEKAAKLVMRRLRDKTPYDEGAMIMINGGNPQMVEGHPANMVDKYNSLIEQMNMAQKF